jgi:hypothetical protein
VSLDAEIDKLYQLPLADFTAARNALAKTVKGDDAARVKRLEKPTVVPWTINQLYWRERKTFDRLMASGRALRSAQIAALKGKGTDLRAATAEHREVLAAAVATATQLAADAGTSPQADTLARMLEALSLAQEPPANPGRLTEVLQPAGFEALAGVTPVARLSAAAANRGGHAASGAHGKHEPAAKAAPKTGASTSAPSAAERQRAERAAAERKAAQAAVHASERQLDRARAALARTESHADAVRQQLERAERDVAEARKSVADAERELARHRTVLDRLE